MFCSYKIQLVFFLINLLLNLKTPRSLIQITWNVTSNAVSCRVGKRIFSESNRVWIFSVRKILISGASNQFSLR